MAARSGPDLRPLVAVFVLSGASGLVHEVAWARSLGQTLGNSLFAVTAVLACFLGGLGLGSAWGGRVAGLAARPLRTYAVIEGLLAICGLLAPLEARLLPAILETIGPLFPTSGALVVLRVSLAALVLAPLTLLMGATLPLLVREADRRGAAPGPALALLYGANTLGAAAGTLLGSFAGLPLLGTRLTFVLAALLNAAAGGMAWRLSSAAAGAGAIDGGRPQHGVRSGPGGPPVPPHPSTPIPLALVLPAATLSGFSGAALQIGWTRVAALAFGSTVFALGAVLFACILGLGAGPLLLRRRLGLEASPLTAPLALGAAGAASLLILPALGRLPVLGALLSGGWGGSAWTLVVLQFAVVLVLLLPVSLAQGCVFPALATLAGGAFPSAPQRTAGRLYAASAWGSVAGFAAVGFWILPGIGVRRTLAMASIVSLLAAILMIAPVRRRGRSAMILAASLVLALLLLPWLLPPWDADLMSGGGFLYGPIYRSSRGSEAGIAELVRRRGEILFSSEDGTALVTVRRNPAGVQSLQINGKTEASTGGDMSTQLLSAHLPLLLHPGPRSALVIGLASGITLGAAERHPLATIDVIEIAPGVVRAAALFDAWSGGAMRDRRVRVIVDDARGRLLTRSTTYDVITSQPSNPWVAGVPNLFTIEFYALVRARLASGGLFCQWVQAYRLTPDDFRGVVRSFLEVFPDATLWEESAGGGDYFLIGGGGPPHVDPERLREPGREGAWNDLRRAGVEGVPDLLSRYVSGPEGLRHLARGARRHTDDDLYLETRAPLTMFRDTLQEQLAALGRIREGVLPLLPAGYAARDPGLVTALDESTRRRDLRLEIAAGLKQADLWGLGDPYLAAGIAALRAGILDDAVRALSRAVEQNPASGTAHYLLGEAYRSSGLEDAAAIAYAESVRRDPDLAPAWNALGRSLAARGDAARATVAFTTALRLEPDLPAALNNLAALRLQEGRLEEAEDLLNRALAADPDLAAARANLGLVLKRRGDTQGAIARYREALERDPMNLDARYNLASLLQSMGRAGEALAEVRRLRALAPADEGAQALERTIEGRGKPPSR